LAKYLIHARDFRHPITRKDINTQEAHTIIHQLMTHGHPLLAGQLQHTYTTRLSVPPPQPPHIAAGHAYELISSLLMEDIVNFIHSDTPNMSNDMNSIHMTRMMQYIDYTRSVLHDGTVGIPIVRDVLLSHTNILMRTVEHAVGNDGNYVRQAMCYHTMGILAAILNDITTSVSQ
jgi:hypothetical protein